jgi:hypothetical protein
MRMTIVAVLMSIGIALVGTSQMIASPITGRVINKAAATMSPVTKVPCRIAPSLWSLRLRPRRVCW